MIDTNIDGKYLPILQKLVLAINPYEDVQRRDYRVNFQTGRYGKTPQDTPAYQCLTVGSSNHIEIDETKLRNTQNDDGTLMKPGDIGHLISFPIYKAFVRTQSVDDWKNGTGSMALIPGVTIKYLILMLEGKTQSAGKVTPTTEQVVVDEYDKAQLAATADFKYDSATDTLFWLNNKYAPYDGQLHGKVFVPKISGKVVLDGVDCVISGGTKLGDLSKITEISFGPEQRCLITIDIPTLKQSTLTIPGNIKYNNTNFDCPNGKTGTMLKGFTTVIFESSQYLGHDRYYTGERIYIPNLKQVKLPDDLPDDIYMTFLEGLRSNLI